MGAIHLFVRKLTKFPTKQKGTRYLEVEAMLGCKGKLLPCLVLGHNLYVSFDFMCVEFEHMWIWPERGMLNIMIRQGDRESLMTGILNQVIKKTRTKSLSGQWDTEERWQGISEILKKRWQGLNESERVTESTASEFKSKHYRDKI